MTNHPPGRCCRGINVGGRGTARRPCSASLSTLNTVTPRSAAATHVPLGLAPDAAVASVAAVAFAATVAFVMEISSPHPLRLLAWTAVGLVLVSFATPFIRRFLARRQFARSHGCRPIAKSCNRDPFLGLDMIRANLRAARDHKALETSRERYSRLGNTFTSRQLMTPVIMTIEPDNIKTILALNFKDYGVRHRLERFSPLLGAGIFDTDGDHWATSRALIRPNFARDQVADLASFERLIPDLFALIPRDGHSAVDLQELFFRYTIDSATEFLFGQSVGSLKRTAQTELDFAEAFNYAQDAIRTRSILGPLAKFYRDPKADRCNRICRQFAQQFVDEAVRVPRPDGDVTDKSDMPGQKYIFSHQLAMRTSDKRRILDELMNVLLAGRDTTASLLSNMFFMLAKHPAVWAKLRQEVASLYGRVPTYEMLRNLKYLKCCMSESLRLHPVVPMNAREALRDTVLPLGGGSDGLSPVFVAKGTQVAYNVYAMHRRPDFYGPDAHEFRPERWQSKQMQPRWEYLPFNGGPRICVGQQYALTEVGDVRIAQEFQTLESRDPAPWEESLTLTLCSRNGTKVCLVPA
ncbi:n-alkane-inducible cytochrome P450 [Metarhizium album ARSEF 1941]|uniref:N-alkane-inducible cytochrome P450 n=1 Tax=Metarhizium album (strain ARSEF 1941) TaxID=1081103 RepID=A0A0B2WMI5_METAS|nr:n-alkane-inducible cytochrome P450 [Metarhizium album ARSEF 1941]KHN94899.1 n-alkane-inducible cytochrome P450 [Metarhizium album ARSEF 1941]